MARKKKTSPRREDPLDRARTVCLDLPEAHEVEAWGAPTFRVRNKLFAMFADDHHGDGRVALWIKAAPGVQENLVAEDEDRFFRPPYVGPSGWVGVRLDLGDAWDVIADLCEQGYRLVAPKKLVELLDDEVG